MNAMHIDFFFHDRRQKQEEMKGFFQVEEEEEEEWCLVHASNIFSSIKKNKKNNKKNRVGWQQFWEVRITPCCNKALIWALDNVSALCLYNTLNLTHLAFLWFAVLRDTPLVTFLSFFPSLTQSFSPLLTFYLSTILPVMS